MTELNVPQFYSVKAVAEVFGVTPYTVREWCKNGTLEAVQPGKEWRIPESEVIRLAHERYGPDAQH